MCPTRSGAGHREAECASKSSPERRPHLEWQASDWAPHGGRVRAHKANEKDVRTWEKSCVMAEVKERKLGSREGRSGNMVASCVPRASRFGQKGTVNIKS